MNFPLQTSFLLCIFSLIIVTHLNVTFNWNLLVLGEWFVFILKKKPKPNQTCRILRQYLNKPWLTEACKEGSIPWTNLWDGERNTTFTHFTPLQQQFLILWRLQGFYFFNKSSVFLRGFCPKSQPGGLMRGSQQSPGDGAGPRVLPLFLPSPWQMGAGQIYSKEEAEMGDDIKRNIVWGTQEEDQFSQGRRLRGRNTVLCWQPPSCSPQGQNPINSSADFSH